jgi:hypothetical protein
MHPTPPPPVGLPVTLTVYWSPNPVIEGVTQYAVAIRGALDQPRAWTVVGPSPYASVVWARGQPFYLSVRAYNGTWGRASTDLSGIA